MSILGASGLSINDISYFRISSVCSIQVRSTKLHSLLIIDKSIYIIRKVGILECMSKIQVYIIIFSDAE